MNTFPSFLILMTLWLSAFNLDRKVLGNDPNEVLPSPTICLNCTVCEQPCQTLSPSLPPLYGASPPPASSSNYPSYGAPAPPPSPSQAAQANCPPVPVQCCQYPSQPNPYQYEPVGNNSSTLYLPLSTFSITIQLLSVMVLF